MFALKLMIKWMLYLQNYLYNKRGLQYGYNSEKSLLW